ncbi:MAG: ATP-binding protein [Alphaproteobacteria bacterium]|nr:ATP-binding protein [Alphaproteobacteria bacterium]
MSRLLPKSLGAQLVLLLLAALALSHLLGLIVFSDERQQAMRSVHYLELLERAASMVRVLEATPTDTREEILLAVGSPRLRYWITKESALPAGSGADGEAWLSSMLEALLPKGRPAPVRVLVAGNGGQDIQWGHHGAEHRSRTPGRADDGGERADEDSRDGFGFPPGAPGLQETPTGLTLSVPLADGSWLNVTTRYRAPPVGWAWPSVLSMLTTALAIMIIAALTVRRITRPLTALAAAAEKLGRGEEAEALDESGPMEVRRTTAAFNAMQERLTRFVRDRTTMLAAIGHDLRTPITALRLRAELVEDEETRDKLLQILEEMQRMTEATLAFAREEATREATRMVDLAALAESLCDDLAELGMEVSFAGTERVPLACRPVSLKRAIRNLIENGVAYGKRARVTVDGSRDDVRIVIDDDGPGIPAQELERVFGPFVRLEGSRSRETGGIGLGMAIARSIVRGHGGDIVLENRREGGLRATIRLPKKQG